jgi:hypothetical protein
MIVDTLQYQNKKWSVAEFPKLTYSEILIIIFAAPSFINEPGPIKELADHYAGAKIIGCSTAGEIAGAHVNDASLSVTIIQFEKSKVDVAYTQINKYLDSHDAGKKIVSALAKPDLKHLLVLSEGLNINGSSLIEGINSIKDKSVSITGGLAGDGSDFKNTWVIYQGRILTNVIVAAGFYGEHFNVEYGSGSGWKPFGTERTITRSSQNVLFELDGEPALKLYKHYLGEQAKGLPATGLHYPMAIRASDLEKLQLVRTILGVNEPDQSLIFAGNMPVGFKAQLMRASSDELIDAAKNAVMVVTSQIKNSLLGDAACIAISCVGRRLVLGERASESLMDTINILPNNIKLAGFYAYAELSFNSEKKLCELHNQTMTLSIFYEL